MAFVASTLLQCLIPIHSLSHPTVTYAIWSINVNHTLHELFFGICKRHFCKSINNIDFFFQPEEFRLIFNLTYHFLKKLILLYSKNTLNRSKVTVKTFIKIYIPIKCSSLKKKCLNILKYYIYIYIYILYYIYIFGLYICIYIYIHTVHTTPNQKKLGQYGKRK